MLFCLSKKILINLGFNWIICGFVHTQEDDVIFSLVRI